MIGFWHPFGAHGLENRDQIILRKRKEIADNKGWTLWSFQNRPQKTLEKWTKEINKHNQRIFVLCSDSPDARTPAGKCFYTKKYKAIDTDKWENVPFTVKVPHPFGKKNTAVAFKVKAIYGPEKIQMPKGIKWLCMNGKWREDDLPTRGEYLIKSGKGCKLRKVYQILELKYPYLTVLKK